MPKNRRAAIDRNSAFADLGYALYLGDSVDSRDLLASSTGGALLHGRRAFHHGALRRHEVAGGDDTAQAAGRISPRGLWWTLGSLGLALTLGAATLVGRLRAAAGTPRSSRHENAHLYAEQRSVAQTLQHSLLAEAFPEVGGLEFGARYVAGVEGIDIGGDWYDVVRVEPGKVLLLVGDVSGRGLEAATMMASLRYAARGVRRGGSLAGRDPHEALGARERRSRRALRHGPLCIARHRHRSGDRRERRPSGTAARHAKPRRKSSRTTIGVPVGVGGTPTYAEVEFAFPCGSTLLLYTDGAIERRGERLDVGVQRLRDVSRGVDGSLEVFLDRIVSGVLADGAADDTALLGVRWRE